MIPPYLLLYCVYVIEKLATRVRVECGVQPLKSYVILGGREGGRGEGGGGEREGGEGGGGEREGGRGEGGRGREWGRERGEGRREREEGGDGGREEIGDLEDRICSV